MPITIVKSKAISYSPKNIYDFNAFALNLFVICKNPDLVNSLVLRKYEFECSMRFFI